VAKGKNVRLGIATSAAHPAITAADLLAANAAAKLLGAEVIPVPWDSPSQPTIDALVIRSTWGYHHHVAEFEAWLRGLTCRVFNPVPLMLGNLNKIYLQELSACGVPIVPTVFFKTPGELPGWPELVVKPAISASSHLTFRVNAKEAPAAALKVLERSLGLAQPLLKEIVEAGEISAIFHKAKGERARFSHSLRKVPAKGDFRVQAEFGGLVAPYALSKSSHAFCELTLSKIDGEWLYARVDFVETAAGALLCELELVEPYLFYDQPGADLAGFARSLASHLP
jgi:glutathione synthase/RimK-type ligase-like ATP-grasp enzyme